jgi:FkbM family methyltransferase
MSTYLENLGFSIANLRENLKDSIRNIGSKVESLRALIKTFKPWHVVLQSYFFGSTGEAKISINNKIYNRSFYVSKSNVNKLVFLAKIIQRCPETYSIDDVFSFKYSHISLSFSSVEEMLTNVELLYSYTKLCEFQMTIKDVLDEKLYIEAPDGTRWLLRKDIPSDVLAPLIQYENEPYEWEWVKRYLTSSMIFLDVGAYIGGYSVRACLTGAQVIAVEPDPDNYDLLVRNLELNGCKNFKALNIAAGDQESIATLYVWKGLDAATYSLLPQAGGIRCTVKVYPLDRILQDLDPNMGLFIKVDVEGYELYVLKGMKQLLTRADYLMVETSPKNYESVMRIAKEAGLKPVDIVYHKGESREVLGGSRYYNIFFKRKHRH